MPREHAAELARVYRAACLDVIVWLVRLLCEQGADLGAVAIGDRDVACILGQVAPPPPVRCLFSFAAQGEPRTTIEMLEMCQAPPETHSPFP